MVGVGGFSLYEEIVQRFGIGLRGEASTLRCGEAHDSVPVLGSLDDTAQGGDFTERACYYSVGGDHEVFDQHGRPVALLLHYFDGSALQHDRHHFGGIDVQRAMFVAELLQGLRRLILQLELLLQFGGGGYLGRGAGCAFEPGSHRVIGELRFVADDGAVDVARLDCARGIDHELDDNRGAVDIGEQGRGSGRKLVGDHREIHDAGIDRGGFARGMLVDGGIFGDEGVDVGDAYHDLNAAVGQALGYFDLVEVFRGVVVDRRPEQAAQIGRCGRRGERRGMSRYLRQLLWNGGWEVGLKALGKHDLLGCGLQVQMGRVGIVHEVGPG